MQCTTILAAVIFCTVVSGQEDAGSAQCGCLEVPATSTRRRDRFCRPHLTNPAERRRYRSCVCRLGLVRNSWGDCITKQECTSCKCFPDRDFNVCGRECPLVCNEPMSRSCSKSCAFGCDCVSGFVRNSRHRGRCVKAAKCGFTCPQFSSFQFCSSTCRPRCGRHPRRSCVTRCTRGDCVCNQGYAEVEYNGETICVPQAQCSQYVQVVPPMTPGSHGNISSGGSEFAPGLPTMPVNPIVVSGGSAASSVPGSVGINGNVGSGGSSGATVLVPVVPSTPVIPAVATAGAAGTPAPGSVAITGNHGAGGSPGTTIFVPVVPSTPLILGEATGGTAGSPGPGSVATNGNQGAGGTSGGISFMPGASSPSISPAIATGSAAGMSGPGSIGINGASPTSTVPTGGMSGVAPIVGGGNHAGSIGTAGASPIPGGTGIGSVVTYSPGGVAARPNGAIGTYGRPPGDINGFGTVGVGISTNKIRPNGAKQSGEDTGVDPLGIPIYEEGRQPSRGPAAAETTSPNGPNGNSGAGSISGGLHPGGILANHTGSSAWPKVGVGSGLLDHGGVSSSVPATPGSNIESTRPTEKVIRPDSPVSAGTTVSIVTPGGIVTVSKVPSVTLVGAGTVSNGINGNVGLAPAIPSTSTVTTGSMLKPAGTSTHTVTSLGSVVPGVIGNGKASEPSLTPAGPSGAPNTVPTGSPGIISAMSPQSQGIGTVSVNSHVSSGASSLVSTGITATGGATSAMPTAGVATTGMLPGTLMGDGRVSSPLVTSSAAPVGGVNGRNGFGKNTITGSSITTNLGVATSPVTSSTQTLGTAAAVGGVSSGLAVIAPTPVPKPAHRAVGINSAALSND